MTEDILFARMEPMGDFWRAVGLICAETWNAHNGCKLKPEDFVNIPDPDEYDEEEVEPQSLEEVMAIFLASGIPVDRREKPKGIENSG